MGFGPQTRGWATNLRSRIETGIATAGSKEKTKKGGRDKCWSEKSKITNVGGILRPPSGGCEERGPNKLSKCLEGSKLNIARAWVPRVKGDTGSAALA